MSIHQDTKYYSLLFSVVEHFALSAADHASKLFKMVFPDSKTAQQFACGRTKTTSIVKCLAKDQKKTTMGNILSPPS